MPMFNRRTVLVGSGMALANGSLTLARSAEPPRTGSMPSSDVLPSFPSTDPDLVGAVVLHAHSDLDRVVELVTAHPHLARASVDWGFGDWESALGAASHMGRRDIADFLIDTGARPNIFSAAILGQLGVVKALVEASPGVQRIPGPHGITLLAHARFGGEAAEPVVEYLEGLGDADLRPETIDMTDQQRQQFIGTYDFNASSNNSVEITERRGILTITRSGREFGSRMYPVSDTEFGLSASPSVRIAFEIEDSKATAVRIIDNQVLLTANRVNG